MAGFLDVFDIVLYIATCGAAKADDPLNLAAFDKGHVVEGVGLRRECDQPQFVMASKPHVQSPTEMNRMKHGLGRSPYRDTLLTRSTATEPLAPNQHGNQSTTH